jgi:hypothetical protein
MAFKRSRVRFSLSPPNQLYGAVAQWTEHLTSNQKCVGSSPTSPAIYNEKKKMQMHL